MSSPNKITFGNNAATSYTLNNNSYGYASGDNIPSSYSAYRGATTGINGATTTTSYQTYEPQRDIVYGNNQGYTTGVNYSTVQAGSPVGTKYQAVRDVYHPAPVTKITFGGKNYTETFTTQPRYQTTTNYVAPATTSYVQPVTTSYVQPVTSYQTYQTYHQPTEIQTGYAGNYQQPIRQQVRYEQKIQTPVPRVQTGSRVQANVPAPVVEVKKPKKGGCPAWLWPLLGILALLALIIGLLFGLGVFGGRGGAAAVPTPNGAYTVVDQTIILSKDNITAPVVPTVPNVNVTTPTVNVTAPTVNVTAPVLPLPTINVTRPQVNITTPTIPTINPTLPTVNITTPTLPTVNITTPVVPTIPTVVQPSVDSFDPVPIAPIPVVSTTTSTSSYSYPTGYTATTGTSGSSSVYNTYPTVSGSTAYNSGASTSGYNTYPTPSAYTGYGSNPSVNTISTRDYVDPVTVGLRRL